MKINDITYNLQKREELINAETIKTKSFVVKSKEKTM